MNSGLELFYFIMFGAAILVAPLMGAVWLAVRLLKIPTGRLKRGLYQGAVVAAILISFLLYEVMKAR
ncbi:MAG: hypothetical protein EON96_15905 [Caulobacteraceae bacterium]|nr:MAG: hypothetical protein EON96_15905 [Caulobacteraceae bacterium]